VGLDVTAFINVSINYPKNIASFERWVDSEPQVLECHHVTGEHTLLMKVKCRNTEALEQLISQLRSLDSVDRTDTTIVLSTRTERVAVPLEPAGEVAAERRAKERKPARRGRGKAS
jgi:Lrp/AsnC family leucine-responsive transcriptional regulator